MNTPLIDASYKKKPHHSAFYFQKFSEMKDLLEKSLSSKHIWNVEYEEIKHFFSSVCEGAMDQVSQQFNDANRDPKFTRWPDDPRNLIPYFFGPHLAESYLKRLLKWQKKENYPKMQEMIDLYTEVAAIYDQLKQVKPFIEKGRKPDPNAPPPDLTHTGQCGICMRVIKLGPGNFMVAHGFQISGGYGHYFGYRQGNCFGVKYQPLELSNKANIAFKKNLEGQLKSNEEHLSDLKAGHPSLLWEGYKQNKTVKEWTTDTDPRYAKLHSDSIRNTERDIKYLKDYIQDQERIITNWVATPLKHGGHSAKVLSFLKKN